MRGLIGHESLAAGEGLLLKPAPSIHTAFMRFPIDALFLDGNLRVLDIVERLRPWRVASKRGARSVLELSAGESARRGVRVGDQLGLRDRRTVEEIPVPAAPPQAQDSESIIWPADGKGGKLARLVPMRVLVISNDRHFASVSSMLLSHRGCSVITSAGGSRLTGLIARERVDVVLIDSDQSAAETALAVAAIRELADPVGVVVVSEVPMASPDLVLAKWAPFEELFAAIERADGRRAWGATG